MGNSSTKLAEKCHLLSRDEVPVVASSFKFVSKNSERIKEDDLMVSAQHFVRWSDSNSGSISDFFVANRNSGAHKWIHD